MTYRDFFRMTILALNGRRVTVVCHFAHSAANDMRDYVKQLQRYEVKGWRASFRSGSRTVYFDGGGCVRFVSEWQHLHGVDILYDAEDDLTAYLR